MTSPDALIYLWFYTTPFKDVPYRLREKFGGTVSNCIRGVWSGSAATREPNATDEMYEDVGDPGEFNLPAGLC